MTKDPPNNHRSSIDDRTQDIQSSSNSFDTTLDQHSHHLRINVVGPHKHSNTSSSGSPTGVNSTKQQQHENVLFGWFTRDDLKTGFIILCNIVSSVSLIMINKVIMKTYGFQFVLFLTLSHFVITAIMLELCAAFGMFESKRLPLRQAFIFGLMNVGSIVFMNLSLQTNSVGFYQITKLLCIPATVFIQTVFYRMHFTWKVKSCLAVIVLGVGVVTVTDVDLNMIGTVFGIFAIFCTSVSQIFLGEGQNLFKLTPLQMLHSLLLPQAIFTLFAALPFEIIPKMDALIGELSDGWVLFYILLSCLISVSVNFFTIALIGATSAVTSQVIGHLKVILVLVFGHIMFDINALSNVTLFKEIIGVTIALSGVTFYSYLRKKESMKESDLCDEWFGRKMLLPEHVSHKN